jgi:hypothetical protein
MKVPGISLRSAAIQLASLGWISLCFAGPPSLPGLQLKMAAITKFASNPSIRRTGGAQAFGDHAPRILDLRPPPELPKASEEFSGDATRKLLGSENRNASSLAELSMTKSMSPAEAFARRVHQEGLPVARLWETRSALVSVGLNQKGKPGLWLIQKTH